MRHPQTHRPPVTRVYSDFLLHGHLPGSGVQAHSAGGLFPYVTYVQAVDGRLVHGFMAPGQPGILVGSYDQANAACLQAKLDKEALDRRQAQLLAFQASRRCVTQALAATTPGGAL